MVVQGGTGNDEFTVYANQAELRLEGDDDNDLFVVRSFALAAVVDTDANGDGLLNANDLDHPTIDRNHDGKINAADAHTTPLNPADDDGTYWQDDVIVFDQKDGRQVARPIIGGSFSVGKPLDIRSGGGEDEVQYNVNAAVSVDGGTGLDKLAVLGTEFADDIVISTQGIFGAGLNVRYSAVEVVEVDGLEGDDEFFVQSTAFGVAYRVIGGLGSDSINVTGDITEDIVTRELEGTSGSVDHLVRSADPNYDGLAVDGIETNVASANAGNVVITETNGFTAVREGGAMALAGNLVALDKYFVRLAVAPTGPVYVTVSAARSPQEEADDILHNPSPLTDGVGDTIWLTTGTDADADTVAEFQRRIIVIGVATDVPRRALVLVFTPANWNVDQAVYTFAVDDLRSDGDRVVPVGHSIISG